MDLFDDLEEIAQNATEERNTQSDNELADWINSVDPEDPTPEAEAFRLGEDLAGCPSWSQASYKAIHKRLYALLERLPEADRPAVASAFMNGQHAFQERRKAMKAVDVEWID